MPDRGGTPLSHNAGKPIEPERALTAIRGLAAWWVVAFHFREQLPYGLPASLIRFISAGYLAVDLFFVLSGYVIALNYGNWFSFAQPDIRRYGRFLGLRLSRIYPLHLFMLLIFLVNPIAVVLFSTHGGTGDLHIGYYFMSLALVQGWGFVNETAWNVPAWSISAEWLAYLVFPLLAAGVFRLANSMWRAGLLGLGLLVCLAAAACIASPAGLGAGSQLFDMVRCLLEFSVGLAIFRLGERRIISRTESNASVLLALACGGAYAISAQPDYVFMPLGFAAAVHGLSDESGWLAALLRAGPLQYLGRISYATYLCHYLIKTWIKFTLVRPGIPSGVAFLVYIVAVLGASALLHHLIERPGQRRLRRFFDAIGKQRGYAG